MWQSKAGAIPPERGTGRLDAPGPPPFGALGLFALLEPAGEGLIVDVVDLDKARVRLRPLA